MRLREQAARSFTEELYSEQLEFQTSLLLRCTKLYNDDVLLLTEHPKHVEMIKSMGIKHRKEESKVRDVEEIYAREYQDLDEFNEGPLEE